jgi:hypothetical protein
MERADYRVNIKPRNPLDIISKNWTRIFIFFLFCLTLAILFITYVIVPSVNHHYGI